MNGHYDPDNKTLGVVLARKGNETHAFQVTTWASTKIRPRLRKLTEWNKWQLHIFFVRPSLTDYYDIEVPYTRKAISVPSDIVRNGGVPIEHDILITI